MIVDSANSVAAATVPAPRSRRGVAVFPLIFENPYQQMLYTELARHGYDVVDGADFKLRWLWRERARVGILHFHWPQNYYRWWRRPRALRTPLSWVKMGVFAWRLRVARLLGLTVVWTIHEVYPHERAGRWLDRVGSRVLAAAAHVLIAHDEGTVAGATGRLSLRPGRIEIVGHGSYIGVYPPGRSREEMRAALGIEADSLVFLCFGHIRAYKAMDVLLRSLESPRIPPGISVVVAGVPLNEEVARAISVAAAGDARVKPILRFVPDECVAELFEASDVAVLPRGDGGTSGALVLALSMGKPVVAAATPEYARLIGSAGWLFEPGSVESLADALAAAAAAGPEELARRGGLASTGAARLGWPEIAARTASLFAEGAASFRRPA